MFGIRRKQTITWLLLSTFSFWSLAPPEVVVQSVFAQPNESTTVPAVTGLTAAEAVNILKAAGLSADVHLGVAAPRDFSRLGVYEVTPDAGTSVRRGTEIRLLIHPDEVQAVNVSSGVPDVIGRTVGEAKKELTTAGYDVELRLGFPSTVPERAGKVYYQSPLSRLRSDNGQNIRIAFYAPSPAAQPDTTAKSTPQNAVQGMLTSDAPPRLLRVVSTPLRDESVELVEPRSGLLSLRVTDILVPAGAAALHVTRTWMRQDARGGALGARWRLNWEKQIFSHGNEVPAIDEPTGLVVFKADPAGDRFISDAGDVLAIEDSHVVRSKPDGDKEFYSFGGRLLAIERNNGNRIKFTYSGSGHMIRVDGPFNSYLDIESDEAGRIVQIKGSSGAVVRYEYNADESESRTSELATSLRYAYDEVGNLASTEHPHEGSCEYTYDDAGRVLQRLWADGARERHEYSRAGSETIHRYFDPVGRSMIVRSDLSGRVIQIEGPTGSSSTMKFNERQQLVEATGPTQRTARIQYDEFGRIAQVDDSATGESKYAYDDTSHRLVERTGSAGQVLKLAYDGRENRVSVRDGDRSGQFTYRDDGLIAAVTTDEGVRFELDYDANGFINLITDPLGNKTRLLHDRHGNLIRLVDALGNVSTWTYDRLGKLTSETDPLGATTRYEYSDRGLLVRKTEPEGAATGYNYDSRGRLISEIDSFGNETRYAYHADGQLSSVTDAAGHKTRFEYDRDGNPSTESNAVGGRTTRRFDSLGRIVWEQSPTGSQVRYQYDAAGNLARQSDSDGRETKFAYDARGRVVAKTDSWDGTTRYEYDERDNLENEINDIGSTTTFDYDERGRIVASFKDQQLIARYAYDDLGRQIQTNLANGRTIAYEYDAVGNLIRWSDNLGDKAQMDYDAAGRLVQETSATGAETRYRYDSAGNLTAVIDANGNQQRRIYDDTGQLTGVIDGNGDRTTYEYDVVGNLSKITHSNGNQSSYEHDGVGRAVKTTDPAGQEMVAAYDVAGRLVQLTDAKGQETNNSYDLDGRLIQKQTADGVVTSYRYDRIGNLIEIDDGEFPIHFTYDKSGNKTKVEFLAIRRQLEYEYDSRNRRILFTDAAGHRMQYNYDDFGRLAQVSNAAIGTVQYEYDSADRWSTIRYSNGIVGRWRYDTEGRVKQLDYHDAAENVVAGWSYGYDSVGNVTSVTPRGGTAAIYSYDRSNQLLEEQRADGEVVRYSYLPGGDRRRRDEGDNSISYEYESGQRLTAVGDEVFTYDANGNLVQRKSPSGITQYRYNAEDRLIGVSLPDGSEVTYGYASTGERIWRQTRDGKTWYIHDGLQLSAILDKDLRIDSSFMHGHVIDRPLAGSHAGKSEFFLCNRLGSVAAITDSRGKLLASPEYDAFGGLLANDTSIDPTFSYVGREFDPATGLYYFRNRWYDPATGRFLTKDRASGLLVAPLTQHAYAYVINNPLRYIDPMGLQPHGLSPGTPVHIELGSGHAQASMGSRGVYVPRGAGGIQATTGRRPPPRPGKRIISTTVQALEDQGNRLTSSPTQRGVVIQPPVDPTGIPDSRVKLDPVRTAVSPEGTPGTYRPTRLPRRPNRGGYIKVRNGGPRLTGPASPGWGSRVARAAGPAAIAYGVYRTASDIQHHWGTPLQNHVVASHAGGWAGGYAGGALVGWALGSNPIGWTILAGIIGGTLGSQVFGGLVSPGQPDPTQGNSPPQLDPNHPMTGDVADNPLFQRQQQSAQSASPPADPLAGTPSRNPGMRGRDFLRSLPDLTQSATSPPTPSASSNSSTEVDRQIFRQLPPPTRVAGTPVPSKPSMDLPPLPKLKTGNPPAARDKPKDSGKLDGLYVIGGAYNAVATRFTWKTIDANTASVTLYLDGRESNIMRSIQAIPPTATVVAKRAGASYVAVNQGALPTVLTRSITFTPVAAGTINYSHVQGNGISTSGVATKGR